MPRSACSVSGCVVSCSCATAGAIASCVVSWSAVPSAEGGGALGGATVMVKSAMGPGGQRRL